MGSCWLTPLEKWKSFDFALMLFLESRKPCFFVERNLMVYLGLFKRKTNFEETSNFRPKPWVNPFGKRTSFRLCSNVIFVV